MSLKTRLTLTLAVAFIVIVTIGGFLTYYQARASIADELEAAQASAANRVAQLIAELPATRDVAGKLQGFVRSHNGDRDIRIMLIDSRGQIVAASQPARIYADVSEWFVTLLSPPQPTRIIPLSGLAAPVTAVVVSIDPRNEIAETWSDAIFAVLVLTAFILVTFLAIWIVVGTALRPITAIKDAYEKIGNGQIAVRVDPEGPPEVKDLAHGLNRMADRLGEASIANRRLSEQLQRLQDEERAALARDLHDDVGPLLFAIDVEAGAIMRKLPADETSGAADRAKAIKANAMEARKAVRRILTELRPGVMAGLGLKATLEDHIQGLAERYAQIAFKLEVDDATLPAPVETTVFRAIREAVHNALKHGLPRRIAVRITTNDESLSFCVSDDGGGFADSQKRTGFGLIGMAERIEAAGGRLSVKETVLPAGVRIEGSIPLLHPGTAGEGEEAGGARS